MTQRPVQRGIPSWAWVLAVFGVTLFSVVATRTYKNYKAADLGMKSLQTQDDKLKRRAKAEELARKGFEALSLARRNRYVLRCREDGNYPLLFIDKIVCVKPESIAWVKYDDIPEQEQTDEVE